jgi:TatA/E family protein of Tat protein translocase
MLGLGPPELIIIALVILALFGYKKLPDAARAIGRSARIFKAETKGLRDDPAPRDLESKAEAQYVRETPPPATPPPPPATPPPPTAASPTPSPSPSPTPSATPAPSPAPSPSATPAQSAAPVPPQPETF